MNTYFDIWQILLSLLQFGSVSFFIWALFRQPYQPEPPINRRIALALGIQRRQTVFDIPFLRPFLSLALMSARRFPFFRQRIRQDLEASGNPSSYSVDEYTALCLSGAVVLTALCMLLVGRVGSWYTIVLLISPLFGFIIPLWSLKEAALSRTNAIGKQLPYTLDLIAILMEAGATFTEAVNTVIRDNPSDDLNQEFRMVLAEIEFGSPRGTALASLAERVPLESLRGVIGAVNQAEQLGTPLSGILKNQAVMLRNMRTVKAEDAAAKASLRILIPSMLIMLAVVIVVFAPLVIQWILQGGIM